MKKGKDYNWMIMFFLIASAIVRFAFNFFEFSYVDHFVTIISLIGLDYAVTNILNGTKYILNETIDNKNNITNRAKNNKKNRIQRLVYIVIILLVLYNILHFVKFSCPTGNDMLSMIVLAISLTDDSIITFLVKHNYIIKYTD